MVFGTQRMSKKNVFYDCCFCNLCVLVLCQLFIEPVALTNAENSLTEFGDKSLMSVCVCTGHL